MEIAGYIASIFIGLVLGLIGGGGSILTVPVLVFLFSIDAVIATAYSLFIVGLTSAFGALSYYRKRLVNLKTALLFGVPSIAAVFLTRALVIPAIPEDVFSVGDYVVTKSILILLLFAALMILASYKMIKPAASLVAGAEVHKLNYPLIIVTGISIGFLTGLVGAGGGFLIIPALVLLCNIPMKEAIGTSLTIITANTLIGFLGVPHKELMDWIFLLKISGLAILGIFIGIAISRKIDGPKLKPIFGWFVLVMGIYIILKETVLK